MHRCKVFVTVTIYKRLADLGAAGKFCIEFLWVKRITATILYWETLGWINGGSLMKEGFKDFTADRLTGERFQGLNSFTGSYKSTIKVRVQE